MLPTGNKQRDGATEIVSGEIDTDHETVPAGVQQTMILDENTVVHC